ncbi:glycosyltransferase [Phormidesmis sp. 146-35]
MRVLFVSNSFYPDYKGGGCYNRMLLFVEALRTVSHLDMLFYVSPETDTSPAEVARLEAYLRRSWHPNLNLFLYAQSTQPSNLSNWKRQAKAVFNFFHHPYMVSTSGDQQVQAFEKCLDCQPDVIFVHRLHAMPPVMLTQRALPPTYLDLDDVEHKKFFREISQPPYSFFTNLYYLQMPALWWGESRALCMADSTFVCSDLDRCYLSHRLGLPGVMTLPNATTIPESQALTSEPTLLFLGAYGYQPNVNAANFLIEQVWPQIYRVMPNARLIIAGASPERIQSYDRGVPGVDFTGFVDDLTVLYQRVRVVCCPIFSGGGTRVKMIEAAAYGKPIVAAGIGAEGLQMQSGREYLQCDSPKKFAEACLELLKNDRLCEQLGMAARETAIRLYDRANIVNQIRQYMTAEDSGTISTTCRTRHL